MTQTKTVTLEVTPGLFRGLASQNMLFHQCIGELVDNSIAVSSEDAQFRVDIIFDRDSKDNNFVDVWVADNTAGMNFSMLKRALQPGAPPATGNRLNEHGFGLKNALATLCQGSGDQWGIWTRPQGGSEVFHVKGPFDKEMNIQQLGEFPQKKFFPRNISTLVKARVPFEFIGTVQGRGRRSADLTKLSGWLIEHLGVHYRGYLNTNEITGDPPLGKIYVGIKNDKALVKPLPVPMGQRQQERINVEIGGKKYTLLYYYGVLDEEQVKNRNHRFYYQGNTVTQGIDIRLGHRVIITHQLRAIWGKAHDPHFNKFVGELLIPDLPPNVLKTKNDKTDFNFNDPEWETIFRRLREVQITPPKDTGRKITESEIREEWKARLKAQAEPDEIVGEEIQTAWETSVSLDLYKKSRDGSLVIYELKRGPAEPLHLYQLKMYWDGLVLRGDKPRRAELIAEKFSDRIKSMAETMNEKLRPPKIGSKEPDKYNFVLKTLVDAGLIDAETGAAKITKRKKPKSKSAKKSGRRR